MRVNSFIFLDFLVDCESFFSFVSVELDFLWDLLLNRLVLNLYLSSLSVHAYTLHHACLLGNVFREIILYSNVLEWS